MSNEVVTISLVIISSFDKLCLECNNITRKQSHQYKIPVLFLFNGRLPEGYVLKADEQILQTDSTDPKPWMFLKFKNALKNIYSISDPDFILRCNATTFINFKRLAELVFRLPREKCIAGPFLYSTGFPDIGLFCQGTNIFFSKDVAKRLAFDNNENHPAIHQFADDIAIELLTKDYSYKQDITLFTARYVGLTTVPKLYELLIDCTHVFFRVKNEGVNRFEIDFEIWKMLHYLFDYIHYRNDFKDWGENQFLKMPI